MFGYPKASAVMARAIILKYQIVIGMATPPSERLASWMKSWSAEDQSKFLEETKEITRGPLFSPGCLIERCSIN